MASDSRQDPTRIPPESAAAASSGPGPIIEAALVLLRERRALDLSMREIAAAAGVAPSLLAYHFETRLQLLARVGSVAGEAWRRRLEDLVELAGRANGSGQRAEVAAAWMSALIGDRPDFARLWGDLLLAAAKEPSLAAAAGEWVAAWRAAWSAVSPSPLVAEFAAFEMIFAAPLAGAPDCDLIRREALARMLRRAAGEPVGAAESHWHTAFCLDRMDPLPARSEGEATVKSRIIDAAADIISESGAADATHRAIAARAGASLSSMTYHFKSRAELVREGLLRVFERSMTSRPADASGAPGRDLFVREQQRRVGRSATGEPGSRLAMVRAIAEVAQEASIDPAFRPVATELRRIRGLVTRAALGNALGLSSIAGAAAADYAVWESGASLLLDVERAVAAPERPDLFRDGLDAIFPI